MIRLVVNADNLGTTAAVDAAILRAHRDGVVTSASLIGNAEDPAATRDRLRDAPRLGVGIALALTGGNPVSPVGEVASLLSSTGTLRVDATDFAFAWLAGRIVATEVEREFDAQIRRVQRIGLTVDHLNTRAHVGFLPGISRIVESLARRHGIAGIRTTVEPPTLAWVTEPQRGAQVGLLGGLAWLARRQMGARAHGPASWGYLDAGRLDEIRILEIVGRMGPGAHELICHPEAQNAAHSALPNELTALTSEKVRAALSRRGIELCRWRDLF